MNARIASLLGVFATGALVLAAAVPAQQPLPPGSAERGKAVYMELLCNSCHGSVGQGGGPPGGGPKIAPDPFPPAAFALQLRKPRLDMPAYTARWVSDQEVADMHAYLASIRAADAPAQSAR